MANSPATVSVDRRIQCRIAGRSLVVTAFVAMALLLPVARADDGTRKGVSASVAGAQESASTCADGQNAGAEEGTNEKKKKPNLLRAWINLSENWLSPVATTSGRLKQEFRYDIWDQPASGNRNYQLGRNKGLELITSSRTQILIGVPAHAGDAE